MVHLNNILHRRADKVIFPDTKERAKRLPVITAAVAPPVQRPSGSGQEQQLFRPAQANLSMRRIAEGHPHCGNVFNVKPQLRGKRKFPDSNGNL